MARLVSAGGGPSPVAPSLAPVDGPVLVALSGGVDSAVAALLLREQGVEVAGITLKTFCYGDLAGGPKSCCGLEGVESARAVASRLGMPHLVLDVSESFQTEVIDDFVREYAAGRTPNPCVVCNATVKIPHLLDYARRLGYRAVATGHYAQVRPAPEGGWALHRGVDGAKDQSYFLWAIPRSVLAGLCLPLGGLTKPEVRVLAARAGLASAHRPESQEICFIPDGDYVGFLRRRLPPDHPGFQPGPLVDAHGRQIGTHAGYLAYTIGQRRGLGGGHGRRLFVIGIDPARREVRVGEESDLLGRCLRLERVNPLIGPRSEVGAVASPPISRPAGASPAGPTADHRGGGASLPVEPPPPRAVDARSGDGSMAVLAADALPAPFLPSGEAVLVQIRHRASPVPGRLVAAPATGPWDIVLDQPARAITPGQSAVLYQGDRVIAGGRIVRWRG